VGCGVPGPNPVWRGGVRPAVIMLPPLPSAGEGIFIFQHSLTPTLENIIKSHIDPLQERFRVAISNLSWRFAPVSAR
jgi:hypothetical protein